MRPCGLAFVLLHFFMSGNTQATDAPSFLAEHVSRLKQAYALNENVDQSVSIFQQQLQSPEGQEVLGTGIQVDIKPQYYPDFEKHSQAYLGAFCLSVVLRVYIANDFLMTPFDVWTTLTRKLMQGYLILYGGDLAIRATTRLFGKLSGHELVIRRANGQCLETVFLPAPQENF